MKSLSIAGTAAMFLVGGGILEHGIAPLHHYTEALAQRVGNVLGAIVPMLLDALIGIIAGAIVLTVVSVGRRFVPGRRVPDAS